MRQLLQERLRFRKRPMPLLDLIGTYGGFFPSHVVNPSPTTVPAIATIFGFDKATDGHGRDQRWPENPETWPEACMSMSTLSLTFRMKVLGFLRPHPT